MKKKNIKSICLALALLSLSVVFSAVVLGSRLQGFSLGEQEVIPLIPEAAFNNDVKEDESIGSSIEGGGINSAANAEAYNWESPALSSVQQNSETLFTNYSPVAVSDDQKVWGTETDIEVFKVSYKNGSNEISVLSSNGDKLIAPGTENEYTFRIKNNSNAPINYKMTCEVFTSPKELFFPVEMSMKSYTGDYLFGSSNTSANVGDISEVSDSATLQANNYAYYTLNWQWPFEWDNDEYDTYLGNRAVDEDLTVTVVIKTIAQWDDDSSGDGLKPPVQTGDDSNMWLFVAIALISAAGIVILIFKKRKLEEDTNNEETDQS